jgi:hypothetical protein
MMSLGEPEGFPFIGISRPFEIFMCTMFSPVLLL